MAFVCQPATLSLPNERGYVPAARRFVAGAAAAAGFGEAEASSVSREVGRCLAALMAYSFGPNERASIELVIEPIPSGIRIRLRDRGLPFGAGGLFPDNAPADEPMFELGRLFDEVRFDSLGPEGKEIVLVKQLPDPSLSEYAAACRLEPAEAQQGDAPAEERADATGCGVRFMQPAEANEVSKLVYRAYGYSYPHAFVYYPERIRALNQSGAVVSAVAVAGGGRIAGHCALKLWEENPAIAELAQGVVAPEFRSRGCFSRLTAHLIEAARTKGLAGLFSEAVTRHPYSQKAGAQHGLRESGFLLATVPAQTEFKGIGGAGGRRGSMLLQFKYLQPAAAGRRHAPEGHREMIAAIYEHLGEHLGADLEGDAGAGLGKGRPRRPGAAAAEPVHRVHLLRPINVARICIDRFGKDPVGPVHRQLKALCRQHWDAVHLFLSLADPQTAYWCARFEELGFFFAGILPWGLPGGDALILQYLNNVPGGYGSIRAATPFAARLLDYIRSRDPNRE
jgi:serine/threonine-protein kinase RsbW